MRTEVPSPKTETRHTQGLRSHHNHSALTHVATFTRPTEVAVCLVIPAGSRCCRGRVFVRAHRRTVICSKACKSCSMQVVKHSALRSDEETHRAFDPRLQQIPLLHGKGKLFLSVKGNKQDGSPLSLTCVHISYNACSCSCSDHTTTLYCIEESIAAPCFLSTTTRRQQSTRWQWVFRGRATYGVTSSGICLFELDVFVLGLCKD